MSDNLYDQFRECFPTDLSKTFIETGDGQLYSYADLDQQSARLANLFVELGLHKGDRVAVQVDKSPQAVFLYLACIRAGLIFLPLNTGYQDHELEYFCNDAKPELVVVGPEYQQTMERIVCKVCVDHLEVLDSHGGGSLMDRAASQPDQYKTVACRGDDVASILYTSGTTGKPKGAMISHLNLASNARSLHSYWGWDEKDVLLHALPIFHVHGLFVACNCVLMNGSSMLFLSKFDVQEVIELLPRATVMMGVPTFYTRLLANQDFDRDCCKKMRLFISGSAPLLEQTFTEFKQRTGHKILERYGMTETGMNTSNPLYGDRIAGTVGFPLPGVEARVVDAQGQALPSGEKGVLEVRGDNVFKGYWRLPGKTAEDFREDGFFITGDLATMDKDGRISIVGRAKDLVISGGYNVYPKELENMIDDIDGVKESAVIGVAHPDYGEGVTAIIVKHSGTELKAEDVMEFLKGKIARYKQPQKIFFIDELPRNTMGKVQKKTLREAYSDIYSS